MDSNSKEDAALEILREVNAEINNYLGNTIAIAFYPPDSYDSERDIFCEKMVNQCELAEKKSQTNDVLFTSNMLKSQLYGCWEKLSGVRGTHGKSIKCDETALELASNDEDEAFIRYQYGMFLKVGFGGSEEMAKENFERAIELVGANSPLGIDCANQINKGENINSNKSKKGCFIATAVYGSPYAPEVELLKEFRDNWLLKYSLGKVFVKLYYLFSPKIARTISSNKNLKEITKRVIVIPLLQIAKKIKVN